MSILDEMLHEFYDKLGPEADNISLKFIDLGETISNWTSYNFKSDFMSPTNGWSFECTDLQYFELFKKIQTGTRVSLTVNNVIISTGYVDQINILSSRSGGTIMQVRGRDALSPICDTCIDPKFKFSDFNNVKGIIKKLIEPYNFKNIEVDSSVDLVKLTSRREVFDLDDTLTKVISKFINEPINNKFKPHPGEGIYEFIQRLGRRFGFHAWSSSDGETLYVSQPNYNQPAIYSIVHDNTKNDNNKNLAIESTISYDWSKQPSVIIAEGHGGGGHFRKQSLKVLMVNELLSSSDSENPEILKIINNYKEAKVLKRRSFLKKPNIVLSNKFAKPLFLYDDESKNITQLQNYVQRAMSDFQSKFLTVEYTVNRHSQMNYIGDKSYWTPNTIVEVDDVISGFKGNLWIKAVTYTKSRGSGTKTTIECILPHTLQFTRSGD